MITRFSPLGVMWIESPSCTLVTAPVKVSVIGGLVQAAGASGASTSMIKCFGNICNNNCILRKKGSTREVP